MPSFCYREWFAEVANDPHVSFAPVLRTYRADANNGTTQAELNAQWAEDEDHNPLLGFDEENRHYVVHAGRRVPRSAGGTASRHAGRVIAQCGDVAAGATGGQFVHVADACFARTATENTPVFCATAGHLDALIGADADNIDLLVPAGGAAGQDHTAVVARGLVAIPYHAVPLLLGDRMSPKQVWSTLGGYLRGHADAGEYEPILQALRLAMTHVDGDIATSRMTRPIPPLIVMDPPLDAQRSRILQADLPDKFDPTTVAVRTQAPLVAAANTFTTATTQLLAQQTAAITARDTKTPKQKFQSSYPRVLLLTGSSDDQALAQDVPIWQDLSSAARGFETSVIRTAVEAAAARQSSL